MHFKNSLLKNSVFYAYLYRIEFVFWLHSHRKICGNCTLLKPFGWEMLPSLVRKTLLFKSISFLTFSKSWSVTEWLDNFWKASALYFAKLEPCEKLYSEEEYAARMFKLNTMVHKLEILFNEPQRSPERTVIRANKIPKNNKRAVRKRLI